VRPRKGQHGSHCPKDKRQDGPEVGDHDKKVQKGARLRRWSTEILVKTSADPNDQDTKDNAALYSPRRTWRRGSLPQDKHSGKLPARQTFRVSLDGRH